MNFDNELRQILKTIFKKCNGNYYVMGAAAGVCHTTARRWMNGEVEPSASKLLAMIKTLELKDIF